MGNSGHLNFTQEGVVQGNHEHPPNKHNGQQTQRPRGSAVALNEDFQENERTWLEGRNVYILVLAVRRGIMSLNLATLLIVCPVVAVSGKGMTCNLLCPTVAQLQHEPYLIQ